MEATDLLTTNSSNYQQNWKNQNRSRFSYHTIHQKIQIIVGKGPSTHHAWQATNRQEHKNKETEKRLLLLPSHHDLTSANKMITWSWTNLSKTPIPCILPHVPVLLHDKEERKPSQQSQTSTQLKTLKLSLQGDRGGQRWEKPNVVDVIGLSKSLTVTEKILFLCLVGESRLKGNSSPYTFVGRCICHWVTFAPDMPERDRWECL